MKHDTKKQETMKLLLTKSAERGRTCSDGIGIGKTSISIKGTAFDRIVQKNQGVWSSIGINEEGNLCLYVSFTNHRNLYKMYFPKKSDRECRISLNTKTQGKVLTPYVGNYEIKYVSVSRVDGITEVVLKKN
jgi:hypothetical protein